MEQALIPDINPEFRLNDLASKLIARRLEKEELDAKSSEVGKQIEETELKMIELMQVLDRTKFDYVGLLFYLSTQTFPKIVDEDGFFQWLAENGEDGIIKRTIYPQTLRGWYKEKRDLYAEILAERKYLEIFEKIRVNVKKAK